MTRRTPATRPRLRAGPPCLALVALLGLGVACGKYGAPRRAAPSTHATEPASAEQTPDAEDEESEQTPDEEDEESEREEEMAEGKEGP